MSEIDYSGLIKLHDKNGYYVNILGRKNRGGCTIEYPSNYLTNQPIVGISYTYMITEDGLNIYSYKNDKKLNEIEYKCPDIARRIIIYQDIILKCFALGISVKLLKIKNELNESLELKDFFDILAPPKDTQKERQLKEFLINLLNGELETAEGLDVEIVKIIIKLLEDGGF